MTNVTVIPIDPATPEPLFVNKDVFLFHMFTLQEQIALERHSKLIPIMADWGNPSPSIAVGAYRALSLAERRLNSVGRVDVKSPATLQFLQLAASLNVFGADPAVQATRIDAITKGILPDGTFVENLKN